MKLPNLKTSKELKFKKTSLLILSVLLASSLFVLTKTNAQESTRTITVTPPTVSVTGNPGYKTEGTMGVINDSDAPITFRAEMHDFIVQDTSGTPQILPPNTFMKTFSAAAWMGVSPQTFTILPKKRQNLNYFIQIPITARPGGHYAAVVFVPVDQNTAQNSGAIVSGQVGTLFSIAVNGKINENATVTKFTANGLQEYGPVNILSQIKNNGDLHIRPQGNLTVSDLLGRKTVLPLKENNIFPGAARDYSNEFGSGLMLGRFKVELLASYGVNNNLPLMTTIYFWVFPWKVTVILVLVIVALVLGAMYFKKRKNLKKPTKPTDVKEEVVTPETSSEAK